jgi:hypothetical protein
MTKKKHTGKINRHEKICQTLLTGKPISPDEIKSCFTGTDQEKVLYRLSANILDIRLDGGVVKVYKNGRKVIAYQLMNPEEFDANGRYKGKVVIQTVTQPEIEYTEEEQEECTQDELVS